VPWTLTVRRGGRVEHERFDDLGAALGALEARAHSLGGSAPRRELNLRYKKLEPADQVFARLELAGPERFLASARGGVDIRGDGSMEPYVGRIRRRAVEQMAGESPVDALGRVLQESS
jgi:hypothetical protein